MQNRGLPPADEISSPERIGPDRSLTSIAQDFAALVAILEHQLTLVSPSDQETRSHISSAKTAAERGAKLSRDLIARARARGDIL